MDAADLQWREIVARSQRCVEIQIAREHSGFRPGDLVTHAGRAGRLVAFTCLDGKPAASVLFPIAGTSSGTSWERVGLAELGR